MLCKFEVIKIIETLLNGVVLFLIAFKSTSLNLSLIKQTDFVCGMLSPIRFFLVTENNGV